MSMAKGVYVLVISVCNDIRINVGALGCKNFEKGLYAYVGSAQKGLEKRLERHLKKAKQKFWHIDYLLDNDAVKVLEVFSKEAGKPSECEIAEKISSCASKKGISMEGFGSSDCKCTSHLFKLKDYQFLREFMHEARMQSEY